MSDEHAGIDVRLLGPVRARRDGIELVLGSARPTAVFSVLALHANHAVSREQLVAAVWGEELPASATGNIYTYVSALRQALEPDRGRWAAAELLISSGGTYCLRVGEQDVDALRFEALREQSRRHRATGDRLSELTVLRSALRLWHGEPLAGVPGPFAAAQRERLGELRLASAEREAALLLEFGRYDEAIAALCPLVEAYPLQQALHGMLMEALHAHGLRDEALSVHDRLSELLLRETGTGPSATLRALHRRILGRPAIPAPRPAGPPVVAEPAVLIGREAEIALLRRAVADVTAGRGRSIRIEGPPGTGKSALLSAALSAALPAGCRVGRGLGAELGRHVPLGVLSQCVEAALETGSPDDPLQGIFAVAAAALDESGPDVVEQTVALIRRAATEQPLVLIVDDLQWADAQTLWVWAALHAVTREVPLLLVAAARPGKAEVHWAGADDTVALSPLSPLDAAALVHTVATVPVDPGLLPHLLADAGGNPSYLRHLAMAGGYDPAGEDGALPAGLVTAITAQLAPFGERTRHILRAVAFLGGRGTIDEVAAVTGSSPDDLLREVEPARSAEVLDVVPDLTFRYPIMARVLRGSTPAALRNTLHRSFAERIADAGGSPERVVAQLLASPVALGAASSRWLVEQMAELAVRAPAATLSLLQRVHAQQSLDREIQLALTAWLARLLYGHGRSAVAEARWVAVRTTDLQVEGEMRWIAACSYERRGEHDAAADVARRVLSTGRLPEPWLSRFRMLITRLRADLPGEPTAVAQSRTMMLGELLPSADDQALPHL